MARKILISTIIFLMIPFAFVFGQASTANVTDNGKITESAAEAERLFLAYQAAKFGRENKSPDALIFAASILKTTVTDKIMLEKSEEGGQADAEKKESINKLTADAFLADAKILAKKDRNLLGRIITVSKMKPDKKGAMGGPKRATTEVRAYATDVITLRFRGGEAAIISLSGDGDTDLDLYVYDENGNLVASDTSGKDDCRVRFFPKTTGNFKIKVKNLGNVYNRYLFVTN